jgi:hypothetical protein
MSFLAFWRSRLPYIEAACSMTSVEDAFSHDHAKSCFGYSKRAVLPGRGAHCSAPLQMSDHLNIFLF